ncbi:uncharacterized protein LOC143553508 [Bidens hawaiensis]|uniref:uncharacterized protein LOC143553508 n=1 Tax=Bidens hawaiensis TaxID=980011 RepID=UPI004049E785
MSIVEGIKVQLGKQGSAWVDELPHALWAYIATQTSGQRESPFGLTYGCEAVIPAEIGMPLKRIQDHDENDKELRLNLDLDEERREMAAIRKLNYKREMEKYYNKRVKKIKFKEGEYVMRNNETSHMEPRGKLCSRWEGLFIVVEATKKWAYKLKRLDGTMILGTWNGIHLEKCYK